MKKIFIFRGIVVAVLLIVAVFYLKPSKTTKVTSSPTPITFESSPELLQGGSSYSDPNAVYTVLYPNDYIIDNKDPLQVRVYKNGPTQKGQTEMYDGVIVNFGKVKLNGEQLSKWVDDTINEATANGTSEVVKSKNAIVFNNYSGFTYSLRGLGVSEYTVLQKDTNSSNAIVITTLVADPTNVGFQRQVDDILSSLQILK